MAQHMDDQLPSGSAFDGRLYEIEARLATRTAEPLPSGLTEPDADSDERWEAAQVWGHMAEFVGYWQAQMESVIADYVGEPVPFGRTKVDIDRIAAVERGRHEPVHEMVGRTAASLAGLRRSIAALGPAEWQAVGLHPTRGPMTIEQMVDHFVVSHLDEHLDQLDALDHADD